MPAVCARRWRFGQVTATASGRLRPAACQVRMSDMTVTLLTAAGATADPSVTDVVAAQPTPSTSADAILSGGLPTLTGEQVRDWFLDAPLHILFIVLLAVVARWLSHRFIDAMVRTIVSRRTSTTSSGTILAVDPVPTDELPVMKRQARRAARALSHSGLVDTDRQKQRVETLGSVLRSISSVLVWSIAALMIGAELGLNMAPVIASAGVGGVALGFGAQSLVKDFLSGIFMILEDQYGVGDIVDTGDVVGTVEEVTLRVTRVRDMQGVVWYIRNGEIVRIANRSQGWQTASVDVPVSSDEDPGEGHRRHQGVAGGHGGGAAVVAGHARAGERRRRRVDQRRHDDHQSVRQVRTQRALGRAARDPRAHEDRPQEGRRARAHRHPRRLPPRPDGQSGHDGQTDQSGVATGGGVAPVDAGGARGRAPEPG